MACVQLRINLFSEADEDPLATLRRVVTSVQHPPADAVGSEDEWRRQEQLFQRWHEHGTAVTHSEISESSQSSLWSQSALSGTQSSSGQSPIKITPVKLKPKPSGSLAGIIMRPSVTGEEIDTFAGLLTSAESVRTKLKRKRQEPMSTIRLGKKLIIEFHWHANSRRYLPEFVVLQYLILDFSATNGWVISVL